MAGLYQRAVNPAVMQAMKMAASQGAGGAVPRGGELMKPDQGSNAPVDVAKLGGLLGQAYKDYKANQESEQNFRDNTTFNADKAMAAVPDTSQGVQFPGVQQGQAPNNLTGQAGSVLGNGVPTAGIGGGMLMNSGGQQNLLDLFSKFNPFGGGMGGFGGGSV